MRATLYLLALILSGQSYLGQHLAWGYVLGGDSYESVHATTTDSAGNIYLCGYFHDTLDFDPGPAQYTLASKGINDAFLCKLNANGQLLWAKRFGGASAESADFMQLDALGNIYLVGQYSYTTELDPGPASLTFSAHSQYTDIYVLKFTANGDLLWGRSYGGTAQDVPTGFKLNANGELLIAGDVAHDPDFDPGPGTFTVGYMNNTSACINVLDTAGNFEYVKVFKGNNNTSCTGLETDLNGNIVLCGYLWGTTDFDPGPSVYPLSSVGYPDVFLLKLSASGTFIWAKSFGGTWIDQAEDICTDGQGNVLLTGMFNTSVDADPGPAVLTLTAPNGFGGFVSKFNPNGNLIWAKAILGTNLVSGKEIESDPQGSVLVSGTFKGTIDLNPGPDNVTFPSNGQEDAFLLKLNTNGIYEWGGTLGSSANDMAIALHKSGTEDLFWGGYFAGLCDLDPFAGITPMQLTGGQDAFVVKLHNPLLKTNEISHSAPFRIFPNPANEELRLDLKSDTEILICQINGKEELRKFLNAGTQTIDLQTLHSGFYVLKFTRDNKLIHAQKLIIQR